MMRLQHLQSPRPLIRLSKTSQELIYSKQSNSKKTSPSASRQKNEFWASETRPTIDTFINSKLGDLGHESTFVTTTEGATQTQVNINTEGTPCPTVELSQPCPHV